MLTVDGGNEKQKAEVEEGSKEASKFMAGMEGRPALLVAAAVMGVVLEFEGYLDGMGTRGEREGWAEWLSHLLRHWSDARIAQPTEVPDGETVQ